jgi:hypothetical protein
MQFLSLPPNRGVQRRRRDQAAGGDHDVLLVDLEPDPVLLTDLEQRRRPWPLRQS